VTEADRRFMAAALALARAQMGRTGANPAVGCVVIRDGRIIGQGATADGGRPHAERIALDQAGPGAAGGDIYVTLEPCAHLREGGNCTNALLAARPARVVVAVRDPDPRTNGAGVAALREAGIVVEEGLMADEARAVNPDFFAHHAVATNDNAKP
jgi:diaminohydroxyphosphoribosylaminopyrimidine deaminase/5-amino-6-(5-phosphoribosylamino)uracil reductase